MPPFLFKYGFKLLLYAAVVISVLGVAYSGYKHIYNKGFIAATSICDENMRKQQEALNAKLQKVFEVSQQEAAANVTRQIKLENGLKKILTESRKEPTTIIKEGVCYPSKSFSDSFGAINRQANEAIKESQK